MRGKPEPRNGRPAARDSGACRGRLGDHADRVARRAQPSAERVLLTLVPIMLLLSVAATILPLGRRGRARTSLEGDFGHQIEHAEREPGVRRQL